MKELHEAYLLLHKGAGTHHGLCCRSLSRQAAGIAFRAVAEHEKAQLRIEKRWFEKKIKLEPKAKKSRA
ncbi:hypothetical protein [Porphyromonas gingivalis]|uniref:hypothetical protein n=2 Tax=Porphyromonas gingivalis TaxID=837 RepID=UPI001EE6AB96|nr:hypothetical protein [Porphyromonas gingivalis]